MPASFALLAITRRKSGCEVPDKVILFTEFMSSAEIYGAAPPSFVSLLVNRLALSLG
jgi:hypothetical protein